MLEIDLLPYLFEFVCSIPLMMAMLKSGLTVSSSHCRLTRYQTGGATPSSSLVIKCEGSLSMRLRAFA
jgi:hypothetical protein